MIFSDADVRKAVEAARQLILSDAREWSPTLALQRTSTITPEQFYADVLAFARRPADK